MISFIRKLIKLDSSTVLNSVRFIEKEKRESGGSQRRSPPALTQSEEGSPELQQLSQVHWTLRWKFQMDLRQKCLVVETIILRMIISGFNFGDYVLLSSLRFLVKDNIKDFHLRRILAYSDIILDMKLPWEYRREVIIRSYQESSTDYRRVYGNLRKRWKPENYLSIVEVPLDTYMDMKPSGEPYSSYCKGYGEGSSRGLQKTPFSFELDGDSEDEEESSETDPVMEKITSFEITLCSIFVSVKREMLERKQ